MGSGRTSRALFVLAAIACTLPTFPETAHAAEKAVSAKDRKQAQDLFKKSADAYRRGDFQEAIDLLDKAYALDPQPVLLYNLARAHEGLGHLDQAIEAYEGFLAKEPKARDRGAIEQRLETLRRQRDERAAAQQPTDPPPPAPGEGDTAPTPPQPPEADPPKKRSVFPFVVAGAGVAAVGAGVAFGLMASSRESDANAEPVQQRAFDLKDEAEGLATLSTISFIAGGALLAAGATWFFLETPKRTTGAAPARTPPGAGMALGIGPGYVGLHGVLP